MEAASCPFHEICYLISWEIKSLKCCFLSHFSLSDTPVQNPDFQGEGMVKQPSDGVVMVLLCEQKKGMGCCICVTPPHAIFSPPLLGLSPIHNGQVCSTWGNFHFKTFDGDLFQLPSSCNYVLTSLCGSSFQDFNIQMRRQLVDGTPTISSVVMKLEGMAVELSKGAVVINGET